MTIIKKARELGKAIQDDDTYIAYNLAKTANDNDESLQQLIGEFNLKRIALNEELGKEEKNTELIKETDRELKDIYAQIMSNRNMSAFSAAKTAFERTFGEVMQILNMCAEGEDPDTCEVRVSSGCNGGCSSCSGCN